MKKFTAEDIGKTFKTSQEGVTATILDYHNQDSTVLVRFSNSLTCSWASNDGICYSSHRNVYPDQEVSTLSEADLLRKEIEELKAKHEADLRTAIEMARDGYVTDEAFMLYDNTPDEIIDKIVKK